MRAAIYYAPERSDPLWHAGTTWLGRDPETSATLRQPDFPGIAAATASPRRYGFHATLKPPCALARGLDEFCADASALAAEIAPFELPALKIAWLDGFIALVPATPSPDLEALAALLVERLDHHRRPEPADRVAERAHGLDATGLHYLALFGYPHVLDRWHFHMTLSQRLPTPHLLHDAAHTHFATAMCHPRQITTLALYLEPTPGAAFSLVTRLGLGGGL